MQIDLDYLIMNKNIDACTLLKTPIHQAFRLLLLVCLSALLAGCFPIDPCENCRPPSLAISEMRAHGVAITARVFPFPDTIDTYADTDAQYTLNTPIEYQSGDYELELIFSPRIDKAETAHPTDNEWDEHPYAYVFSELVDGEYRKIKPLLPYNFSVSPTTDLTSEFAPIMIDNYPSELLIYGNHLLKAIAAFPKNATHVELWHRQQREDELSLVRRVALDNFYAWRRYIKPAFEADP